MFIFPNYLPVGFSNDLIFFSPLQTNYLFSQFLSRYPHPSYPLTKQLRNVQMNEIFYEKKLLKCSFFQIIYPLVFPMISFFFSPLQTTYLLFPVPFTLSPSFVSSRSCLLSSGVCHILCSSLLPFLAEVFLLLLQENCKLFAQRQMASRMQETLPLLYGELTR